jgi:hypothetical protein
MRESLVQLLYDASYTFSLHTHIRWGRNEYFDLPQFTTCAVLHLIAARGIFAALTIIIAIRA